MVEVTPQTEDVIGRGVSQSWPYVEKGFRYSHLRHGIEVSGDCPIA